MFNGDRVSVWEEERAVETDGNGGCVALGRYSMPQNCTLKNGENGEFSVLCITIKRQM